MLLAERGADGAQVCDANPVYGEPTSMHTAIEYCERECERRESCTGFFFQTHMNGHEICGFFSSATRSGHARWDGHRNGAICTKGRPRGGGLAAGLGSPGSEPGSSGRGVFQ